LLLTSMFGFDPKDSTSLDVAVPDFAAGLTGDLRGKRIGVPREYRLDGMDATIAALWEQGLAWARDAGATIVDVSLPQRSVTVSSHGEIPLNLKLLSQLAHNHHLDWSVRLRTTEGDSIFIAQPFPEESSGLETKAVELTDPQAYRQEIKSVLRTLQVPMSPSTGFSIDVKEGERSSWVCISVSKSDHRQVTLSREMLDAAVRHPRTAHATLLRSAVQIEVPTDPNRKRTLTEEHILKSPPSKRRRVAIET
jgi:Asp-tRNA(Asn)/Glu-tRNA(Gln) amidotransferase A subunit family amidase